MKRAIVTVCALAGALLVAPSALAQHHIGDEDWRRTDRADAVAESVRSPQNFAFELRFGPYYPAVDDDPSVKSPTGGIGPFEAAFGKGQRFYFGLEADWQAFRIPYVGVIGPAFGWGFTKISGNATFKAGPNKGAPSGEETSITIMPMNVSGVIRFDELMRRTRIPIVPYGKLGLGWATWAAANSTGSSYAQPIGSTNPADAKIGHGISWGAHIALGGMLCLNWIDERAAARLDEDTGVNHAYLFGEWTDDKLEGIGSRPQMWVGSSTWTGGIVVDF